MSGRGVKKPVNEDAGLVAGGTGKKEEAVYKVEKLRTNCMKLFGVTTSTFDGAFYGNKATELTVAQAKAVLDKWLGRKE